MDNTNKELELLNVTMESDFQSMLNEAMLNTAPEDPATENICISCE